MTKVYRRDPNERIFYVYVHRKIDNGDIFYVGKGHSKRAQSKSGRSNHWRNIVKKHGYTIEYIECNLTEPESFDLEIRTIRELKDSGIELCNKSLGGEGNCGMKHTEETIKKFSEAKLGKKQSNEHAQKSRLAKLGKKQPKEAVEKVVALKRKKIINSDGDIFESANSAAREIKRLTGVSASQGNISMAANGLRKEAYGKAWSYDIDNIPKLYTGIPNAKKIINKTTGDVFDSVQLAREWVEQKRGSAIHQCISESARSKTKTAYGYKWSYL